MILYDNLYMKRNTILGVISMIVLA